MDYHPRLIHPERAAFQAAAAAGIKRAHCAFMPR